MDQDYFEEEFERHANYGYKSSGDLAAKLLQVSETEQQKECIRRNRSDSGKMEVNEDEGFSNQEHSGFWRDQQQARGETERSPDSEVFGLNCSSAENRPAPFGSDDALNIIAAIFSFNNISKSLGEDIFAISDLLQKFGNITIREVYEKVDSWAEHKDRVYVFCVECDRVLPDSCTCTNRVCRRFGMSQSTIAGGKKVLTYSVREQVEDLIAGNAFNSSLLTRTSQKASICGRVSETPKYIQQLKECEQRRPNDITLLLSVNTDGFRKRGMARGDIWPLFVVCHDVSYGTGSFREFSAEVACLSSVMHSSTKLTCHDFSSAFARLQQELEDSKRHPLTIVLDGRRYTVVLELYQIVLDMDASRKIHGVPNWLSYNGCSRCSIPGEPVATKNGRTISWFCSTAVEIYDDNHFNKKMRNTGLPPPYKDGFDALHLIYEGTSKDALNDLLKNGDKLGAKLSKISRKKWADALDSARIARGMGTKLILSPMQLSSRTGSEVQKIFDLTIPVLICCENSYELWEIAVYLLWIVTRVVTDPHLSVEQCNLLGAVTNDLKLCLGHNFKHFFTMKVHFLLDHLIPDLKSCGSPLLSSAAPYERLNQTLGRHTSCFTTKTICNMSKRFLSLQRCAYLCRSTIEKDDCSTTFPKTMSSLVGFVCTPNVFKTDEEKLSSEEKIFLKTHRIHWERMSTQIRVKAKVFSTRRSCRNTVAKTCFIYFRDASKRTNYGSLERVFHLSDGSAVALIKMFLTNDPFTSLLEKYKYCLTDIPSCKNLNTYFLQIENYKLVIINTILIEGYCNLLEFEGKCFLSRL